jgi:hypothetical protein
MMFGDKPKPWAGKERYRDRMWRCLVHYPIPEKIENPTLRYGIVDNDGCLRDVVEFDLEAMPCVCPLLRFARKWDLDSGDDEITCICGCDELHSRALKEYNVRYLEAFEARKAATPSIVALAEQIVANKAPRDCNGQHEDPKGVRIIHAANS